MLAAMEETAELSISLWTVLPATENIVVKGLNGRPHLFSHAQDSHPQAPPIKRWRLRAPVKLVLRHSSYSLITSNGRKGSALLYSNGFMYSLKQFILQRSACQPNHLQLTIIKGKVRSPSLF